MNYAFPFFASMFWSGITSGEIVLLSNSKNYLAIGIAETVSSLVWGYLIRHMVLNPDAIPYYAVGAGIGSVAGVYLIRKRGI